MRYLKNIVIILLVVFFIYMTDADRTFFPCAVIIAATGIILNKLDKIERCLKENENSQQMEQKE